MTALACESSIAGGRAAFAELVASEPDLSAVIAFNEQATPGLISAATAHGWRVPEEFSVLSVDMPNQAALMTTPAMSTVGPSAAGMGRAVADMLIRRLEGEPPAVTQILFDGQLRLRESSGPARGAAQQVR